MLQLAVLSFFQPHNTTHWDTGSNIANECYTHLFRSIYYCTILQITEGVWQSVNCNIICYTKVMYDKVLGRISVSPSIIIILFS